MTEDRIEPLLRRSLARHPRPRASPNLAIEVLEIVAARQRAADRKRRHGARLVLAVYWLAASLATAWIARTLPWPAWSPTLLWGVASTLVPLGFAISLWPERAATWAVLLLSPLLGGSIRGRRS